MEGVINFISEDVNEERDKMIIFYNFEKTTLTIYFKLGVLNLSMQDIKYYFIGIGTEIYTLSSFPNIKLIFHKENYITPNKCRLYVRVVNLGLNYEIANYKKKEQSYDTLKKVCNYAR